jgi:hypothetical protein
VLDLQAFSDLRRSARRAAFGRYGIPGAQEVFCSAKITLPTTSRASGWKMKAVLTAQCSAMARLVHDLTILTRRTERPPASGALYALAVEMELLAPAA